MTTETKTDLKRHSSAISDGPDRAPARSMLRAVGLTDEDMDKPFVGVANLASDVTPCNVHLGRLAAKVKEGVYGTRDRSPSCSARSPSATASPWAPRA